MQQDGLIVSVSNTFRLNGFEGGDQFGSSLLALSDGGYAVVYGNDFDVSDTLALSIFDADGTERKTVLPYSGDPSDVFLTGVPAIAENADGTILLRWNSDDGSFGYATDLFSAAVVPSDGSLARAQYLVANTIGVGNFALAIGDNGYQHTVIQDSLFESIDLNVKTETGSHVAFYSVGSFFDDYGSVDIVTLSDGRVLLAATEKTTSAANPIYIQYRTPTGRAEGAYDEMILVDPVGPTDADTGIKLAALSDGGFALAYAGEVNGDSGVVLRVFPEPDVDPDGLEPIRVDSNHSALESDVDIEVLVNGWIIVSWIETSESGTSSVYVRVFDQNGAAVTDATRVSSGSSDADDPSLAVLADDRVLVSWTDALADSDGTSIRGAFVGLTADTADGEFANTMVGSALDDTIQGGGGNDVISGFGGNDTLIGGLGDDTLDGGDGADTYFFELDWGHDTVIDASSDDETPSKLVFGEGILVDDISAANDGDDLVLEHTLGDTVRVLNFFVDSNVRNAIGEFADGTSFPAEAGNLYLTGTEENETLLGLDGNDDIYGLGGNDTLIGGYGRDSLEGGTGDDVLEGGDLQDWYYFEPGWGQDTIRNYDNWYFNETENRWFRPFDGIYFYEGISPDDVSAHRSGNDLVIESVDGSSITVVNHYLSFDYEVSALKFEDGTYWSYDILDYVAPIDPGVTVVSDGEVGLQVSGAGQYQITFEIATYALSQRGAPVGPESFAGWQALAAGARGGDGYSVLWQGPGGAYMIWNVDDTGDYVGVPDLSNLVDFEERFQLDLNGDDIIWV